MNKQQQLWHKDGVETGRCLRRQDTVQVDEGRVYDGGRSRRRLRDEGGGTDRAAGWIEMACSRLFDAILQCELRPYLTDISTTFANYLRGESISV